MKTFCAYGGAFLQTIGDGNAVGTEELSVDAFRVYIGCVLCGELCIQMLCAVCYCVNRMSVGAEEY